MLYVQKGMEFDKLMPRLCTDTENGTITHSLKSVMETAPMGLRGARQASRC